VNIMRATLDKLISWFGLLLAVILVVAGGLLTWASTFINDEVVNQLSAQHITMPTAETGLSDLPAADQAALKEYAGQKMTTGPQARAYADHYIAVHMNEASGGKTYSEVSGQYIQQCASDPKAAATQECTDLAGLRQTMFMGSTLRGLLLYGYAFATMGTIAGIAAICSFIGAALMLVLAGIGFWHSRRSTPDVTAEGQPVGAHV
jgi:predicted lipid-binding transport protein (Tim44 family)